jgi:hypothetical protein
MSLFSSQNDSWIPDNVANSPLITRWNETRAERRARKLRERAVARALVARKLLAEQGDDLGELTNAHARYLQLLARRRARELGDLASARAQAMGEAASARSSELFDSATERGRVLSALAAERADALRKQGNDAFENARTRFLETDAYDRLKDLFPALTRLDNRKQRRSNAFWWVIGATVGVAAAGAAIYYFSRSRQPMLESEPLVELPINGDAESYRSPVSNITSLDASKARGEGEPAIVGVKSPAQTEMGPLVGNIRTMVYHDVNDDQELPSEENRIYFASETEAQEAGYHRAGELNEVERQ